MDKKLIAWAKSIGDYNLRDDEFVLDEFVGHGKVGFVYRAHRNDDPEFPYAIKLVFKQDTKELKKEIQKVRRLSQVAGVVHFHQVWEQEISVGDRTEKALVTVWDFIRNAQTLPNYLENPPIVINVDFLLNTIKTVLRVLYHCAKEGVARHGDLHPGNVFISASMTPPLERGVTTSDEIFVADFGYGATGGVKSPKDDRDGLRQITNAIYCALKFEHLTLEEKQMLKRAKDVFDKYLHETQHNEVLSPASIFHEIEDVEQQALFPQLNTGDPNQLAGTSIRKQFRVGDFLSGELFGMNKARWRHLFVDDVPCKAQIFEPNYHTVLTGPRGCGKTTLFRRQSTRLQLLCDLERTAFVGFYLHANHFVDAFSSYPSNPSEDEVRLLISYLHLMVLSDFLDVLVLEQEKSGDHDHNLLDELYLIIDPTWNSHVQVMSGINRLQQLRSKVETIKHQYLLAHEHRPMELAHSAFGHQSWLESFFRDVIKTKCPWVPKDTPIVLLVDDYTTPRPNASMQQVLNSVLFRRTEEYVSKVATEAATTFESSDLTGKRLQINDDFILVDFADVSLQMDTKQRTRFIGEIFQKRLKEDPRIPDGYQSLRTLLGKTSLSLRKFALQLRDKTTNPLYAGEAVFVSLWSGDIRTLLQVMEVLVENVPMRDSDGKLPAEEIPAAIQHATFINRGQSWVQDIAHCQPATPAFFEGESWKEARTKNNLDLYFEGLEQGRYGDHLKAIVEAFRARARHQLFGTTYFEKNREIARSAFRIEITDEFSLGTITRIIYEDLLRYGIFLRDGRGRSRSGTLVPRIFLRRLVLPFFTLGLDSKNCVEMNNADFNLLLLNPRKYQKQVGEPKRQKNNSALRLPFATATATAAGNKEK